MILTILILANIVAIALLFKRMQTIKEIEQQRKDWETFLATGNDYPWRKQ